MILTPEQRDRLLEGKEVEVRVLKKKGEELFCDDVVIFEWNRPRKFDGEKTCKKIKYKFVIGGDYAVQEKGKALWYCNECSVIETETHLKKCWGNSLYEKIVSNGKKIISRGYTCPYCRGSVKGLLKPLRFQITGIKSEEKEWVLSGKIKEVLG